MELFCKLHCISADYRGWHEHEERLRVHEHVVCLRVHEEVHVEIINKGTHRRGDVITRGFSNMGRRLKVGNRMREK